MTKKKSILMLICGILGCICFGCGDWLMIYGDVTHNGSLYWLTNVTAQISKWRNSLAMLLSFPGIIFYGIALFSISDFIRENRQKKIYKTLTFLGLTPWLSLHLFYIMILFLFSWLNGNGYADVAMPACEALFKHLSWIVTLSEVFMLAPFIYWFYLQITKKTVFPRASAFTNILFIYAVMYIIKMLLPDSPFRLGFTNGLMSESMIIWFVIVFIWEKDVLRKVNYCNLSHKV
jgi:hypothetical protein